MINRLILCAALQFICLTVHGEQTGLDKLAALDASSSELHRFVLDNGMICLIKEDHSAPVVAVQIWIGTGAIHEDENLGSGLSHYVEHMIFKGTKKRTTAQITSDIDDVGGKVNAYTSQDRTVIFADLPADGWKVGIDVLSDTVMNSTFPEEECGREKEVVRREIAMNRDDPDRVIDKMMWRTAYAVHPYRFPVIGYEEVLKKISREDLTGYYSRRYTPDNMITVIVGDINGDAVESELRRIFSGFERVSCKPLFLPAEPTQSGPRFVKECGAYNVARMEWAYHTVGLSHRDVPSLDVLAVIAGQGDSSRLVSEIKHRRKLVQSISASSYTPFEPGLFGISIQFDPVNEKEIVMAVREQLSTWRTRLFSAEEVRKAVRILMISELSNLESMSGQANDLGSGEMVAHNPTFSLAYLRELNAVSPESVRAVAGKYLTDQNETIVELLPASASNKVDKTAIQSPAGDVKRMMVQNGIPLITREDHKLPFVYICVACKGGSLSETARTAGITTLMANLLVRGTGSRTAAQIATSIDSLGAALSPFSGRNSFGLSGRCLTGDVAGYADLFADSLAAPSFPVDEVERQKALQLASLEASREEPMFLAQEALSSMIHSNHPYSWTDLGTPDSVRKLERDAVVQHHRNFVVSGNMAISIFGDITQENAARVASRVLRRVKAGKSPGRTMVKSEPVLPARAELKVPKSQAILLMGFPGVSILDPRLDALKVLASATSGMSSDLFCEVREKRGLAYFVGSYQRAGLDPGMFAFYAGVGPDKIAEVEDLVRLEIERIVSRGLRDDELQRARKQLIAAQEMSLQDNLGIAVECAVNELYGLGYRYAFDVKGRMSALIPASVKSAAASILSTNSMAVSILMPETAGVEKK